MASREAAASLEELHKLCYRLHGMKMPRPTVSPTGALLVANGKGFFAQIVCHKSDYTLHGIWLAGEKHRPCYPTRGVKAQEVPGTVLHELASALPMPRTDYRVWGPVEKKKVPEVVVWFPWGDIVSPLPTMPLMVEQDRESEFYDDLYVDGRLQPRHFWQQVVAKRLVNHCGYDITLVAGSGRKYGVKFESKLYVRPADWSAVRQSGINRLRKVYKFTS